jgi:hypothetical protein
MPPRHSVTLHAKATLEAAANFRDEPIVGLARLKTTCEAHLVNLMAPKDTEKRLCSYAILESRYDPVDCEGTTSSSSAGIFEFEGIRLE